MSFLSGTYTNRKPLQCADVPKGRKREIGLNVSLRFEMQGESHVEIEGESVSVNTISFGGNFPACNWQHEAKELTQFIIGDLEKVIAELEAHKARLVLQCEELSRATAEEVKGL
jgi:hypothetical protein